MEPLRSGDPQQIGDYRLIGFLGAGGMGAVYLGKSPEGMLVAVKTVKPELLKEQVARWRFQREIDAVARVGGGFVAELVDSSAPDAVQPWLAARFIPGITLADLVWPRTEDGTQLPAKPLPVSAVWRLALGLIKALQSVHACHIVHRDLKPGNIMLSAYGPRVIDFGVARGLAGSGLTDPHITVPGMVVGTPDYMSPEQRFGLAVSYPSDVYSLGTVLTAASTGIVPERDSLFRPLWEQYGLPRVPGELRELVRGCLESRPENRPALTELMSAVLHGQKPYPPARPSWWPQPTAALVDRAVRAVFGSLPADAGFPTVTDHQGWEQWYLREGDPVADTAREYPDTKPVTVPVTVTLAGGEPAWPAHRAGLDGVLYPAYRPVPSGSSALDRRPGQQRNAAGWAIEGDRCLNARQYDDAERAYRASLKQDPKNAVVWIDLGRTLCPRGRLQEAERAFERALDISPRLIAARRNLYLAVHHMGGSVPTANRLAEELREACLAVLELSAGDAEEYANLGDAYYTLGHCADGAAAYEAAMQLDGGNPRLREKRERAAQGCG